MHWASKYINLPYEPGGRGPERVDCWGLLALAYREHFGITLPEPAGLSLYQQHQINAEAWEPVAVPRDGDAVAMGKGRVCSHVGLWVAAGGGRVLHCFNNMAVVAEPLRTVRMRGYATLQFHRYRLWPG